MAKNVLVDTSFLVALLSRSDAHHQWAATQAVNIPPPWLTCEAVLSETYHLLGTPGVPSLNALLQRRALAVSFDLVDNLAPITSLLEKYSNVPMSLADACLVRMTEVLADPVVLTTDADFRVYRRHSRQVVPCVAPSE